MQEDFQTSRATFVHLNRSKCPFTSGHIKPMHNMRRHTNIDSDTFDTSGVGTSAGTTRPGGTSSSLDELSFVKYRTGLRGGDVNTNTGVESFSNTFHNYPVSGGNDARYPIYSRPMNLRSMQESFAANPIAWT